MRSRIRFVACALADVLLAGGGGEGDGEVSTAPEDPPAAASTQGTEAVEVAVPDDACDLLDRAPEVGITVELVNEVDELGKPTGEIDEGFGSTVITRPAPQLRTVDGADFALMLFEPLADAVNRDAAATSGRPETEH